MGVSDQLDRDAAAPDQGVGQGPAPPLYTREAVATRLAVSKPTVDRLVKNGRLTCVRIGGAVRFHPDDVDGLIESLRGA
jgi:excisionase family DNA binding protein